MLYTNQNNPESRHVHVKYKGSKETVSVVVHYFPLGKRMCANPMYEHDNQVSLVPTEMMITINTIYCQLLS